MASSPAQGLMVSDCDLEVLLAFAVMVAMTWTPPDVVLMTNEPLCWPGGITRVVSGTACGLELVIVTMIGMVGTASRVTIPMEVSPPVTTFGTRVSEAIPGWRTVSVVILVTPRVAETKTEVWDATTVVGIGKEA